MPKRLPSFFHVLTDEQRQAMLIEEVQTRRRTGIQHLSDAVLKKLMLSIGKKNKVRQTEAGGGHSSITMTKAESGEAEMKEELQTLGAAFSYDMLSDKDTAQLLA